MKRKFLAALLALVMVFSMIPVSASAAGHFETGPNGYFTLSYENGVADQSFKVVIVDPEGTQVDSITVSDAATTAGHIVISLTDQFKNTYDIESVNVNEGTVTLPNLSADSYSFDFSPDIWGRSVVTVTLCPQFEAPTIIGDKVSGTTIRYIAEEPDLLKLVYMNEGKVNSTTTIDAVSMHFVEPVNQTGMGADWPMTDVPTGADNLAYFDASVTADWVDNRVQPGNIRYLEISYTTNSEKKTVRVYSGDLRYVVNENIYYIQSDDDSQYIVTFYNHEVASLHEWTLYDVKFVTPGTSIGTVNMPANPTYPESSHYYFTNWTDGPNGGNTFLANTVINDDTVVYAQKHTTTSAPSEIHVINYEGELVNRFVELYNANHPDSSITANDIAMDTVKISVFGIDDSGKEYYTNPDYSTAEGPSGLKNRWIDDDEYYFVYNYLSGAGSAQNDQITNTNEITKFEMSASSTTGESLGTITVNRGTDAGDFEITMGGGSSNYAIEIRINKTPTAPTDEDLLDDPSDENDPAILGKNVVTVTCTNTESDHTPAIYGLLANTNGQTDSYTIGAVTALADGGYTCTITVHNGPYVTKYGGDHTLAENEPASQDIVLTWDSDSNTWNALSTLPVNFNVICDTEPGDDNNPPYNPPYIPPYIPPVDPDDSGVSDLLNTEDHIQYLFGYPEGTFGPENNMTRAEVAQMFYNLLLDQDVTITKTFDDVPANAWYAKAVNTLASLGVVSGVGNGDFEPERSITRAEFTSIAMKFAEGKTGGTNIFSDVKSTDWFYRAVVNSTQYGWIHGYGDGTFRPNNPITRVEVTAIVNNMLGREADVDFVTEHYDELNHFFDLAVSHWGYYHIVEATNDHDYTKPSSGENWTELN